MSYHYAQGPKELAPLYSVKGAQVFPEKHLILDIDETLLHIMAEDTNGLVRLGIMNDPNLLDLRSRLIALNLTDVATKKGTGIKTNMWGIKRPHLDEFLTFCCNYFTTVNIWTAGLNGYGQEVIHYIMQDMKKPYKVFTRPRCKLLSGNVYQKPIVDMIAEHKHMTLENTFIVDDRATAYTMCNPENGILIPAYEPKETVESLREDDIRLLQLMKWFQLPIVRRTADIRELSKTEIFSTDLATYDKYL